MVTLYVPRLMTHPTLYGRERPLLLLQLTEYFYGIIFFVKLPQMEGSAI